jgi:hypothetical protein
MEERLVNIYACGREQCEPLKILLAHYSFWLAGWLLGKSDMEARSYLFPYISMLMQSDRFVACFAFQNILDFLRKQNDANNQSTPYFSSHGWVDYDALE